MRAVVSGIGHATERLAELAEKHLKEHVESQESYIRDTGDFLYKLNDGKQSVAGEGGHKPLLFLYACGEIVPERPEE